MTGNAPNRSVKYSMAVAVLALSVGCFEAGAQGTIGPPIGGGFDRLYDDGFVRVDISGGTTGFTSYWGYQSPSQIEGAYITFHCVMEFDSGLVLVVDRFSCDGIVFFPAAPYSGSFGGLGPQISDAPFSRTVTAIPEPSTLAMLIVSPDSLESPRHRTARTASRKPSVEVGELKQMTSWPRNLTRC